MEEIRKIYLDFRCLSLCIFKTKISGVKAHRNIAGIFANRYFAQKQKIPVRKNIEKTSEYLPSVIFPKTKNTSPKKY